MRKVLRALSCLLSFMLVACGSGNGTSIKAVEEGKIALVSQEYQKAKDLFQLAVNEDGNNTTAKDLLDLSSDYIKLLDIIDSNNYESFDEIVTNIESNNELDIIKETYEKTKEQALKNREVLSKYNDEVEEIEALLNKGNIDEAKDKASKKLEEVSGNKIIEDKLNSIIDKVKGIINDAKAQILKYHNVSDSHSEIFYEGLKDSSYNSYNNIPGLAGKTLMLFDEKNSLGSPAEYMYDRDNGNIYRLNQGQYWLVNDNNKVVYDANKAYAEAEAKKKAQEEANKQSTLKVSAQQAVQIAKEQWKQENADLSLSDVMFNETPMLSEDNEYIIGVCSAYGTYRSIGIYFINAANGSIRYTNP